MSGFLGNARFTKRTYLLNAFASKGVIQENGLAYDSTTLWLMTPQRNPGGSFGLGYETMKWGDSTNFEKIKQIDFLELGPVEVEVELEEMLSGSGDREKKITVVHNLKLVSPDDVVERMTKPKKPQ